MVVKGEQTLELNRLLKELEQERDKLETRIERLDYAVQTLVNLNGRHRGRPRKTEGWTPARRREAAARMRKVNAKRWKKARKAEAA